MWSVVEQIDGAGRFSNLGSWRFCVFLRYSRSSELLQQFEDATLTLGLKKRGTSAPFLVLLKLHSYF